MDIQPWTIEVSGDDSWETMERLLEALHGYQVEIDGIEYELSHVTMGGVWARELNTSNPFSLLSSEAITKIKVL